MPAKKTTFITTLVLGMVVPVARGDCPYDHVLVGQDQGTLFLDTSQLYRHWNADWGTAPDPYGQEYYEFTEMFGGGYIRVEPGLSENNDPLYALDGTRGVDYNILVQRVYATPGLEFFDDLMTSILVADGDTFVLSDYPNHHVHMRYYLRDGLDPTLPYTVSYRLKDTQGLYADSVIYTFNLGAVPEDATPGDTNRDCRVDATDYYNLVAQFGGPPGTESADFTDDNFVGLEDLAIMRDYFGYGVVAAPGAELGATTPEPASAIMMLLGLGAVVRRRGSGTGQR